MFSNCTFEHEGYHSRYQINVSNAALFPDESHTRRGGTRSPRKEKPVRLRPGCGGRGAAFISQREDVFPLRLQKCCCPAARSEARGAEPGKRGVQVAPTP